MTAYSHLSVQEYQWRLRKATFDDASNLYKRKDILTKIQNLIQHNPSEFLKERPDIVVYNKLKHLDLYDKFCGFAAQSLTCIQAYSVSKCIEMEYKLIFPSIMLPLSVSEAYVVYDETRSKFVSNFIGSYSPAGMYDTVLDRLVKQAEPLIPVPSGMCIGQFDNDQIVPKTHENKAYNRQNTTIVNANCHILIDKDDNFQYHKESYPGHKIHRSLTNVEIDSQVPKVLNEFKGCFRITRAKSINTTIEHLQSAQTHENLTRLFESINKEYEGRKICSGCSLLALDVVGRKCSVCGGFLKHISDDLIFSRFQEKVGDDLKCRYYPGTGFDPINENNPGKQSKVLPGDPDFLPPTTKQNIATILNTNGFRAGVNQVHEKIKEGDETGGRFSYFLGCDMYLYIITRDLCKTTFTHVPCKQSFRGEERIKEHIKECPAEITINLQQMYEIPHIPNSIYTFGWILPMDGLWHLEFNCSMRIHQRLLKPIFGNSLANLFGRKTPAAIDNFYTATEHHKGNLVLECVYLAGKFGLTKTYMRSSDPPFSAEGYFKWISNSVSNQYVLMLNQLVFGTLESYFQFKEGVRSGDTKTKFYSLHFV